MDGLRKTNNTLQIDIQLVPIVYERSRDNNGDVGELFSFYAFTPTDEMCAGKRRSPFETFIFVFVRLPDDIARTTVDVAYRKKKRKNKQLTRTVRRFVGLIATIVVAVTEFVQRHAVARVAHELGQQTTETIIDNAQHAAAQ